MSCVSESSCSVRSACSARAARDACNTYRTELEQSHVRNEEELKLNEWGLIEST
jgi:hypothetical protein